MGTSTRTIYNANQPPTVITTGGTVRPTTIRPATVRALEAQSQGLERSTQQRQQNQQQAQATAFYRGQGNYSTLGAEGGYRPRGTATSGGVAIGQAVPANGGIVGGMPAGNEGNPAALAQTTERLANVAQERGPQIGEGNPNDLNTSPRYPQDHYYDSVTGNLWQWQAATETDPGVWIVLCGVTEALPVVWDSPENTTKVIDPYQHYAVRIEAVEGVSGGTITVTPAVGEVAEIGDPISITVADSNPGTPLLASILLRRV